jgi:hypothetical protein
MKKGWDIKTTQQAGEYLVCAELCRRGFITSTYTGNVPDFDVVSVNDNKKTKLIQVKTINKGNWRLDADDFLKIVINEDETQAINGLKQLKDEKIPYVFVYLKESGKDEFYMIEPKELQMILHEKYVNKLKEHARRPKNPESTQAAVNREDLKKYQDRWDILN